MTDTPPPRIGPLFDSEPVYRCPHCHEPVEWLDYETRVPVTALTGPRRSGGPRGPYKLTDEELTRIMTIWSEGGIHAVMDRERCHERTARRWLATARERGLANGN